MHGFNTVFLKSIDSTNDEAKRQAAKGAAAGTVIAAKRQTAGKGRLGKKWESSEGGLFFSVIFRPNLPADEFSAGLLTIGAGLSVALVLKNVFKLDVSLKWPNDVYLNGKKICGILGEQSLAGNIISYSVIGVGVNVNTRSFDDSLKDKATSLYAETGRHYDEKALLTEILLQLGVTYDTIMKGDKTIILNNYKKMCLNMGRNVILTEVNHAGKLGRGDISGRAFDIDAGGGLLVDIGSKVITVTAGEVSLKTSSDGF